MNFTYKISLIRNFLFTEIFILLLAVNPVYAASSSYIEYTYKDEESNYHIGGAALSTDGSIGVAIAGTSVIATDEVIAFTPTKQILWRFDPGNKTIFDVDISDDGSTVVACGSSVWLLNAINGELIWESEQGIHVFDTCAISRTGKKIFAASRQSTIFRWGKKSNKPKLSWTLSEDGFIDKIDITPNGKQLVGENEVSYVYIKDTNINSFTWEIVSEENIDIRDIGISQDGKNVYIIEDIIKSSDYKLKKVSLENGSPIWTKDFESFHTPYGRISHDGERIILSTNKIYYGINGKDGSTQWTYERDGNSSDLDISSDGKFSLITEGLDYIYLFDWDYPESKNRPTRIYEGIFPSSPAVSANSSTGIFEHEDFTFVQFPPGLLIDQLSIAVYVPGDKVSLRYFISNPGEKTRLEARVILSLPQLTIFSDLASGFSREPLTTKSKLINFASNSIPGARIVDEAKRTYDINPNSSITEQVVFEMPDLVKPDWLDSFLSFLRVKNQISDANPEELEKAGKLLDEVNDVASLFVESSTLDKIVNIAKNILSNGGLVFPLLGTGQVELYNPRTNEVFSRDNFFFVYLL